MISQFDKYVMPTYGRFPIELERGAGSEVWEPNGRRLIDLGGGIAVNCLGHCHPEIAETISSQARKLNHVSNLYYFEEQGTLARRIVERLAPGRVFFCNSGAEANEGLIKLARRAGDAEGRFEVLTAEQSFHGRTLATMAATGQDKVRVGFGPEVPGFRRLPFNDLDAFENAISPATIAILIEGVQGEGGLTPATPEFLMGLRKLCDERDLLLMVDAVQCGHFRTGRYQSFQRILEGLEGEGFMPDAISSAKSLGGGFPMGAFWAREALAVKLGPGSHGTTYGGNAMACAIASKILDIIERDRLEGRIRELGERLESQLQRLVDTYPDYLIGVRGLGLLRGVALNTSSGVWERLNPDVAPSMQFVKAAHEAGVLTIPAGPTVARTLPAYTIDNSTLDEGVECLFSALNKISKS